MFVNTRIARKQHRMGKPFKIRLENRTSRNAYWVILHNPSWGKDSCEIRWGAIGSSKPSGTQKKTISEALDKAQDKLAGDYNYVSSTATTNAQATPAPKTAPAPTPPPPTIKLIGPFAEIRQLTQTETDEYRAYDEKGQFLMLLDAEGAEQVADADTFRIKITRLAG